MKPTLYKEELDSAVLDPWHPGQSLSQTDWSRLELIGESAGRLARVLPRRCPTHHQPITDEGKWDDCTCGGAGFLYPDPPDWWMDRYVDVGKALGQTNLEHLKSEALEDWHFHCQETWRVLGTVDTE